MLKDNGVCVDLWKIITEHGYRNQKEKGVEELCELATELARDLQGDGDRGRITEEMADVYVILAQLELIYGNSMELDEVALAKIRRTLERCEHGKD